jgi:hypothetical protein
MCRKCHRICWHKKQHILFQEANWFTLHFRETVLWYYLFIFQIFFHLSSYISRRNVYSHWSSYQQLNHLHVCILWRQTDILLALTNTASGDRQQMSYNSKRVSVIRDHFIAGSNRQRRFKGELFGGPTYPIALVNMWFSELQWCWVEIRG